MPPFAPGKPRMNRDTVHAGIPIDTSQGYKETVNWDWDEMLRLRASYEDDFRKTEQFRSDWQGQRGTVDRYKGHNLAVASAWGLFPESEAVHISHSPGLSADGCFSATYEVPDNDAFWSSTVYNGEGCMFSDDNNLNSASVTYNEDGTVTALGQSGGLWRGASEPPRHRRRLEHPGARLQARTSRHRRRIRTGGDLRGVASTMGTEDPPPTFAHRWPRT